MTENDERKAIWRSAYDQTLRLHGKTASDAVKEADEALSAWDKRFPPSPPGTTPPKAG